jgi:hypothetical protein
MLYPSKEFRDLVLQSGVEHVASETEDQLAESLAATNCGDKLKRRTYAKNYPILVVRPPG